MTNVNHAEGLACVGVTRERAHGGLTDLAWPCGHKITQVNDRTKICYEIPIDRHERHNIRHLQIHTNELYLHCLWPNPLKHSSKQKRQPENA